MPTPSEIDRQIKLEREQIRLGLQQLHANTQNLEDRNYASSSVYGVASIEQLMPVVAKRIATTRDSLKKRRTGAYFKDVSRFIFDIEPEAAAGIACKVTFDKVFSTKPRANAAVSVTDAIGQAIENECMMRHYERNVPGLLHSIKQNYWHLSLIHI